MNIAVFGGTGYAGAHIADELESRGHRVQRIARHPTADGRVLAGSVHVAEMVGPLTAEADVIVVAITAGARDGNPPLADAIPALTTIAAGGKRLAVVGGAGGLRSSPGGPRAVDTPEFPDRIKPEASAHLAVVEALEASPDAVDWFYLRPQKLFGAFAPGARTGRYRTGTDVALVAADGSSAISGADFAIAFADEIDSPAHRRTAFTVGY